MVQQQRLHAAEIAAEPLADRDGEAHFRPIDDLSGEIFAGNLAKEPLALSAGDELINGHGKNSAGEVAIEKRAADFEGDSHGGDVGLAQ